MYVVAPGLEQEQSIIEADHSSGLTTKIFVHSDPQVVAGQVNEWLENNPVRVRHICQSQSEKGGKFVFIISIFYAVAGKLSTKHRE